MKLAHWKIISFTLFIEGLLASIAFAWASYRGRSIPLLPTAEEVGRGVVFVVPLVLINFLLFGPLADRLSPLKKCKVFRDEVLVPLARQLNVWSALCVALSAGVGEELFFRDLLQTELGLIVASLLFAFLHFGRVIVNYYFIASIYLLFGIYFGLLFAYTGSIWTAIITHAVYDFVALTYLRTFSFYTSSVKNKPAEAPPASPREASN